MNRRRFLAAGTACCAALTARSGWCQNAVSYAMPERFVKPDIETEEGGLWAQMARQEKILRRSPLLVRDPALNDYLQGIACRLGSEHCPDIRIYLVRNAQFNAVMAPNGMMQIWSGLLLRMDNEAQLAAVIGHEIGHYLQRHSVDRLRDLKAKSAFGQFLGVFGLIGLVGQMAVLASAFAYGREHERDADRIGALLMHKAGYDVSESSAVWKNLHDEARAREGDEPERSSPLFATHPAPPERRDALGELAKGMPGGGQKGEDVYMARVAPFLDEWLQDEVKRGQYAESLVLFSRLIERGKIAGPAYFYRGETYRLRGEKGDLDLALSDYRQAIQLAGPPPQAHRGIGLIQRQRNQREEALSALSRYIELAPGAPDAELIKTYLLELKS